MKINSAAKECKKTARGLNFIIRYNNHNNDNHHHKCCGQAEGHSREPFFLSTCQNVSIWINWNIKFALSCLKEHTISNLRMKKNVGLCFVCVFLSKPSTRLVQHPVFSFHGTVLASHLGFHLYVFEGAVLGFEGWTSCMTRAEETSRE